MQKERLHKSRARLQRRKEERMQDKAQSRQTKRLQRRSRRPCLPTHLRKKMWKANGACVGHGLQGTHLQVRRNFVLRSLRLQKGRAMRMM